jgi:hypothetical protein
VDSGTEVRAFGLPHLLAALLDMHLHYTIFFALLGFEFVDEVDGKRSGILYLVVLSISYDLLRVPLVDYGIRTT